MFCVVAVFGYFIKLVSSCNLFINLEVSTVSQCETHLISNHNCQFQNKLHFVIVYAALKIKICLYK